MPCFAVCSSCPRCDCTVYHQDAIIAAVRCRPYGRACPGCGALLEHRAIGREDRSAHEMADLSEAETRCSAQLLASVFASRLGDGAQRSSAIDATT